MDVIREIVSREIFNGYDVPKEFGDRFEMVLVPLNDLNAKYKTDKNVVLMKAQEENGFSKNVLAKASEDVWNDV